MLQVLLSFHRHLLSEFDPAGLFLTPLIILLGLYFRVPMTSFQNREQERIEILEILEKLKSSEKKFGYVTGTRLCIIQGGGDHCENCCTITYLIFEKETDISTRIEEVSRFDSH